MTDYMLKEHDHVLSKTLTLAACKDHRISNQAALLHNTCVTAHNAVGEWLSSNARADLSIQDSEEYRRKIEIETEVLINMVSPRKTEILWRFRKRKRAGKRTTSSIIAIEWRVNTEYSTPPPG